FDSLNQAGTATANGSGAWSISLTLGYGAHSFTAIQSVSGVASASSNTVSGSVGTPPPAITSPAAGFDTSTPTFVVSGTGVPGATVSIGGFSAVVASTGLWSVQITAAIGVQTLSATQTLSGITSLASGSVAITVRPPAPAIT